MEREEYLKIYDNGLRHINAAEMLATAGYSGFAISHLILGAEELVKYYVVLNHAGAPGLFDDDEVLPENRYSVFRDHKAKHGLLEEFQQAISPEFAEKFHEYVFYKATNQELKPEHHEVKANRFKEFGSFLNGAYQEINIPLSERESFFRWLKQANDKKNNGFYVNWTKKGIESPLEISHEEYSMAHKFVLAIQKQIEVMKHLDITDEEFIDFLNSPVEPDSQNESEHL